MYKPSLVISLDLLHNKFDICKISQSDLIRVGSRNLEKDVFFNYPTLLHLW